MSDPDPRADRPFRFGFGALSDLQRNRQESWTSRQMKRRLYAFAFAIGIVLLGVLADWARHRLGLSSR